MKTIWKYELTLEQTQRLKMPKGAKILCIQLQESWPCLWAEVESSSDAEERTIELFGTGHEICCGMGADREYISTFQMEGRPLVLHVYEYTGI